MVRFQQRLQDFARTQLTKSRETVAKISRICCSRSSSVQGLDEYILPLVQTHKLNHNEVILLVLKVQLTDR